MPLPKKKENEEGTEGTGPEEGSGAGSGTPATESKGRTWTRGNDPEAAAEELLKANRGSTGGELNAVIPPRTPQKGDDSPTNA